jgi:chloride channel 7
MMIKACGGSNCGYFGSGGYIIFEISMGQVDYQLMELFPMLLLGLLGGVLGSTFNSINAQLCIWRRDVLGKYGPSYKVAEAVFVTFIASLISFGLPLMATCRVCLTSASQSPNTFEKLPTCIQAASAGQIVFG